MRCYAMRCAALPFCCVFDLPPGGLAARIRVFLVLWLPSTHMLIYHACGRHYYYSRVHSYYIVYADDVRLIGFVPTTFGGGGGGSGGSGSDAGHAVTRIFRAAVLAVLQNEIASSRYCGVWRCGIAVWCGGVVV